MPRPDGRSFKIEAEGGLAAAIANGKIAASLDARRAAYDEAVGKRQASLVGVSAFPNLDEAALDADPHPPANGYRLATRFEDLRRIAAKSKPRVFLACLGTQAAFTPRANFAANLYAAGGVQAQAGDGGADIDAIVAASAPMAAKLSAYAAAMKIMTAMPRVWRRLYTRPGLWLLRWPVNRADWRKSMITVLPDAPRWIF